MGRPKQFETDQALLAARELFWRKGFAATSVSDLEQHLGIGRKSLYDTFGDKRQLFLRILQELITSPGYAVHADDASLPHIERTLLGCPSLNPKYRACLLANTTLEFGTEQDPDITACIQRHLSQLEQAFARALERAVANGEILPIDVVKTARYLTTSMQGLAVMAKAGTSLSKLREVVGVVLSVLPRSS